MTHGDHRRLHMKLAVERGDTKKYGRPMTEEQKAKFTEMARRPKSEGTKRKISEAQKGRPHKKGADNPLFGTHCSEETKRKISEKNTGHPATRGSIGMHWYNNGTIDILCLPEDAPEGWIKGRLRGIFNERDEITGRFIKQANAEVNN